MGLGDRPPGMFQARREAQRFWWLDLGVSARFVVRLLALGPERNAIASPGRTFRCSTDEPSGVYQRSRSCLSTHALNTRSRGAR